MHKGGCLIRWRCVVAAAPVIAGLMLIAPAMVAADDVGHHHDELDATIEQAVPAQDLMLISTTDDQPLQTLDMSYDPFAPHERPRIGPIPEPGTLLLLTAGLVTLLYRAPVKQRPTSVKDRQQIAQS